MIFMNNKNITFPLALIISACITSLISAMKIKFPQKVAEYAITGNAEALEQTFLFYIRNGIEFDINQTVTLLLEEDNKGAAGEYPLMHLACMQGHLNVVKILIDYGASIKLLAGKHQ